jgi:hypothetical protein
LRSIVNYFIHKEAFGNQQQGVLSVKNLVVSMLLILLFLLVYAVFYAVFNPGINVKNLTNITGCVTVLGALFALKFYNNKYHTAFALNTLGYLFIMTSLMESGGLFSVDIEWFLLSSIACFLFVSVRMALLFSLLNCVLVLVLFLLYKYGMHDFKADSIKNQGFHELFTFVFLQVVFATMLYFFVNALKSTQDENRRLAENKIETLKQLVEEKTLENMKIRDGILRDFHDISGNKIASICSLSDTSFYNNRTLSQAELSRINELGKEVYDITKDFIWALNVNNNSRKELFYYILGKIVDYFEYHDIEVVIDDRYDETENLYVRQEFSIGLINIVKDVISCLYVQKRFNRLLVQVPSNGNALMFEADAVDGVAISGLMPKHVSGIEIEQYTTAKGVHVNVLLIPDILSK